MESYPRQRARTRGFRLGAPRLITPAPDGARVVFVRSSSGTDAVGDLWLLDLADPAEPREHRLVDARALIGGTENIPDAERARRERMREVGEGIAAFTTDADMSTACFALGGRVFVVDLATPATDQQAAPIARELPLPPGAVDPRISPDGSRVGSVVEGNFIVTDLATGSTSTIATAESDTVTWGLADFIAAEEFSRMRGWWWLADGSAILAERVDNSTVDTWWIADPANPSAPPREQRYPAAGRPNADVSLWLLDPVGEQSARHIDWDHDAFPYLTSVHVGREAGADPVIAILSRDQRHQQVLRLDPRVASSEVIAEHQDDAWVDIVPGVPALDRHGRLVEVLRDSDSDTDRVFVDGAAISPIGFQVRSVSDIDDDGMLVHGSSDSTEEIPVLFDADGWHPLAESGVSSARRADRILVISSARPVTDRGSSAATSVRIARWEGQVIPLAEIASYAEEPVVAPEVAITRTGTTALPTATLWPRDHIRGSKKLPVLLAPYGGPHARRVVNSRLAFATDQWWADQGFCVVIADGRGTPGRGPAWERAVLADLATPVLEDQISALDAVLAAHPDDTDPDRVGIHGWSFGGYLAALAVLREPDRVHAAVAGAPVTEWRLYDTAYTERYLGDPAVAVNDYDHCSLLLDAERLQRPLLLIHGLADDNVVVAHSLQLSSALLAAGRTHSVLPLSGVTHMTPQEVVAENLLLAQRDFLLTHLT